MLVRLPMPFAGTDEPIGLIRRSDTQPSPVGRAFIDAVREVAQQRMAAAGPPRAPRRSVPGLRGTAAYPNAGSVQPVRPSREGQRQTHQHAVRPIRPRSMARTTPRRFQRQSPPRGHRQYFDKTRQGRHTPRAQQALRRLPDQRAERRQHHRKIFQRRGRQTRPQRQWMAGAHHGDQRFAKSCSKLNPTIRSGSARRPMAGIGSCRLSGAHNSGLAPVASRTITRGQCAANSLSTGGISAAAPSAGCRGPAWPRPRLPHAPAGRRPGARR